MSRRLNAAGLSAIACSLAALISLGIVGTSWAQDVPPELLRALQNRGGESDTPADRSGSARPPVLTYEPVQPQAIPPGGSELEVIYSARANRALTQVGYDILGTGATVSVAQAGASQDNYVLGVGDELVFDLRGQENSTYRQRIDRSGRVTLPKLPPVSAAGRTLADFRAELEADVARAYVSTKIFVSLGEVHQVSVLVAGFVRTPGLRILSSLSSPLDAILLSGGIMKSGSLRNVQIVRNGHVRLLDLYSVILKNSPSSLGTLQDGDRIFVPALGPTVAITGSVRLPGIYELAPGSTRTAFSALLALAGGTAVPGSRYDISKLMVGSSGGMTLIPITRNNVVNAGEIVRVDPARTALLDRVSVAGAVQVVADRPLSVVRTTSDLFASTGVNPGAYTLFSIIVRRDPVSNATLIVPFSVVHALNHTDVTPLQSNDTVYVFDTRDIRALARLATKDANAPYRPSVNEQQPPNASPVANPSAGVARNDLPIAGTVGTSGVSDPRVRALQQSRSPDAAAALEQAQALARSSGVQTPSGIVESPSESDEDVLKRISAEIFVPSEMLKRAVGTHVVWVLDQVHLPGPLVAADGTSLHDIIDAAGGPLAQADMSEIEVTSTQFDQIAGLSRTTRRSYSVADGTIRTASIRPFDIVRLRSVYSDRTGETVTVLGEVRYPGVFDIVRDERLSSVLQRAGGITEVGYPYGAIFTRRSAAVREQEANARSAQEVQEQLALLAATPNQNATGQSANLAFLQQLVEAVRNAPTLGRVSVVADPTVLATQPQRDMILEPGDVLYVPKRPSSVTVSGEVLNPGSFQFGANLGYKEYLRMAGGTSQLARESDTFVVLPDGSAQPVSESWTSFEGTANIPPGSTIVVPRDLRPFDWGQFLKDATQIISQLAVSAASLAVLRNN
ncbi:MAG: SLBB domain-containing protein [Reyranella sp.]|nr:SLBB domain-containing protein [Reyranella sp.]